MIKLTKLTIVSSVLLVMFLAINQVALAAAKCTVNGREVPCEELGKQVKGFLGWGIGGFFIIFAIMILAAIFWIMMIVHAAKHNIEGKAAWIVLMIFTGIVGALIYYFVVKRKFNKQFSQSTTIQQ